jgi:hypothetical protein
MVKGYFADHEIDLDQEYVHESFGITRAECMKVRHMIFFSHFSNTLRLFDLYGMKHKEEEVPEELTSIPSDIKTFIKLTRNQKEYEWGLFEYVKYHDIAKEAVMKYMMMNIDINDVDEELRDHLKMLRQMQKIKKRVLRKSSDSVEPLIDDEETKEGNIDFLAEVCISAVKQANYDFTQYYRIVTGIDIDLDPGNVIIPTGDEPEL